MEYLKFLFLLIPIGAWVAFHNPDCSRRAWFIGFVLMILGFVGFVPVFSV